MSFFSAHERSRAQIPAIILWGCVGGLCFAAVSFWAYEIERFLNISCYSGIVFPIFPIWKFGTYIVLLLILGVIAADLFRTGRKTSRDRVLTGLLSGIFTALVGVLLFGLYNLPYFYWDNGLFNVIRIFIGWDTLALTILASVILQALGAWYQGSRQKSGSDKNDTTPSVITGRIYRPLFLLSALLGILLAIPLGLYVLPVDENQYCADGNTCQPGEQCGTGSLPDNMTVSRTSPDSIRISLKASSTCGSRNSFRILLNGTDVSNQDLIAKSGLNVTITPTDGLGQKDGAFVILQGKDVAFSESSPPHIQVMITDRSTTRIHRDLYL
ncbi:MAG: hypothetical protein WC586_12785 [Methanoregula sp.]